MKYLKLHLQLDIQKKIPGSVVQWNLSKSLVEGSFYTFVKNDISNYDFILTSL